MAPKEVHVAYKQQCDVIFKLEPFYYWHPRPIEESSSSPIIFSGHAKFDF